MKSAEKKTTLSPAFIKEMKEKLLSRKEKLEKQLLSFAKPDPKQKDNFNSNFPEFGDKEDENAAEVAVFEGNLSMEENLEQSMEMINRAIQKIEKGTYGICEKCGSIINEERLKIMPTATKCAPSQGCIIKESNSLK
ncbi:TraR/DksA C4-type zinc finger protein [Patescibacteria group bacterium]|nr:TraR/DksA C4-type zinc finger protein [Patescibacteria group bacterium]